MSTPAIARKATAAEWRVLALLVVSICINYIDRGALGIAAPPLTRELHLAPHEIGLLLSAFFWSYASCQILAGWLVDRYDVRWVYGLGFLIWTAATSATGFAGSFAALFGLRLVLGIGESVAYPSYSRILATGFPETHRGTANALIDAGSKVGPALGTLIGGLLVADYGWRVLFIALGAGSVLWLLPWALWAPRSTRAARTEACAAAPGLLEILGKRAAWGTFLGLLGGNYAWYFLLTWLPSYLVDERHYSLHMMGIVGSLPFWGIAASSLFAGWLSDRWIAAGATPTRIRKSMIVGGMFAFAALVLPVAGLKSAASSMVFLIAACLAYGFYSSNIWAATQTLAGPAAAGKWTGLQNAIGNLGGVSAPWITGMVVHKTGSFQYAFLTVSAALVIGGCSYLLLVRRVSPVEWEGAR